MKEGIVQSLKNIKHDLRLINHNRWMVWDDSDKEWKIYENRYNGMGKLIIATKYEEEAVYNLLDG